MLFKCDRKPKIITMLRQVTTRAFSPGGNRYFFKRGVSNLQIGNEKSETIYTRDDYPLKRCRDIIGVKTISILGYGPQGRGQALNLRDNGFNVILGLRKGGKSWERAVDDGWGLEQIQDIQTATRNGDIIKYLLSDAGQISEWEQVKPHLDQNKTLYFSHGLAVTYPELTGVVPPENTDVIMVAPKGAGMTVRDKFLQGSGINSSYAVFQDHSGQAEETARALAFAIGSGHVFQTTFQNEVYSDLTGERCVLMGLIQAAFKAQYEVLRERGHSVSEAYNETVEEALVSLYPLINDRGMDWLYTNCSTTAQRGALDWAPKFEKVIKPIINRCYDSVKNGDEVKRVISSNSHPDCNEKLTYELHQISKHELWQAAKQLRKYRPQ